MASALVLQEYQPHPQIRALCYTPCHIQLLSSQNTDLKQKPLLICSQSNRYKPDPLSSYTDRLLCVMSTYERSLRSRFMQMHLCLMQVSGSAETNSVTWSRILVNEEAGSGVTLRAGKGQQSFAPYKQQLLDCFLKVYMHTHAWELSLKWYKWG